MAWPMTQPHTPYPTFQAAPAAPARPLPTPLRIVLVAMGVCAPGGLLFLLALVFSTNVNFDKPIWFILAALGGAGAFYLQVGSRSGSFCATSPCWAPAFPP